MARDVAADATAQEAGLHEDVAVAVAVATAVVAATTTACLGENVVDECDEQPETKIDAPR